MSALHEKVVVRATAVDPRGDGVASHEGVPLTVAGLFPGEEAEVRIVHRGRRRMVGELVVLRGPDPARREPPCRHHGRCHGCPLMDLGAEGQHAIKRAMLAEVGLAVNELVSAPESEWGYRWSAKRIAFGAARALSLGSYRRGSHEPADMAGCLVDHPDLVACADEIARVGSDLEIAPYEERSRTGDLRYVWLRTDGRGAVLVTLVTALETGTRVEELGRALSLPAAVAVAVQSAGGNDLRGRAPRLLRGRALEVAIAGETVEIGPLGFLQPNPPVAALAYAELLGDATGRLAFDLYAGSGLTTALLRRRFDEVRACESFPESAAALGVTPATAEAFLEAQISSAKGSSRTDRPDLVIANPPRAGMGEAVCRLLARIAPPAIRIMSCHPRSLARDLEILERSGFVRRSTTAFDTLPQTTHVEIVVSLAHPAA
jgi:23S rRNA (uracil1939-C5)-methyltransferase